jgi:hypothetical protein
MGDPFLRAYLTIYDIEEKRIGFLPSVAAKAETDYSGIIYPVTIALICLFITAVACFWVWKCRRDKKKTNKEVQSPGKKISNFEDQVAAPSNVMAPSNSTRYRV